MTDGMTVLTLAIIGACVGSFLNVCIHRLPLRESRVWPGSHCPSCDRALAWYENIPVVSWVALRGRCRTCRAPISIAYPLVEAITAAACQPGGRNALHARPATMPGSVMTFGRM